MEEKNNLKFPGLTCALLNCGCVHKIPAICFLQESLIIQPGFNPLSFTIQPWSYHLLGHVIPI